MALSSPYFHLSFEGGKPVYVDDYGDFSLPADAADLMGRVHVQLATMSAWARFKRWLGVKGSSTLDEANARFYIHDQIAAFRKAFPAGNWKAQTLAEWEKSQ